MLSLSTEDVGFFAQHSLPLEKRGGYLGVGALQNLSYLARCPHAYAVLVDISSDVLEFLQQVFHAVERFEDQQKCLAWWRDQGGHEDDWLTVPELYDRVRELVVSGDIHLVHGDLAASETHDLIEHNVRSHDELLSTLYLSNVISLYHRLQGRDFDYDEAKLLFERDIFAPQACVNMTFEFMPDELKHDLYHYAVFALHVFQEILRRNDTVDEFLAFYLALIVAREGKGCADLTGDVDLGAVDAAGLALQDVEKLIDESDDWLIWQNFRDNFLKREK